MHSELEPPSQPTPHRAKRRAGISRNAIYIPASVPGPIVTECNLPSLPGKTTDFSRCRTPFQTLYPTRPVATAIPQPITTPSVPFRPSIRSYASSPCIPLHPRPSPPFPDLSVHANSTEHPSVQANAHKSRRHCQYGNGYNQRTLSGLQLQHPRPAQLESDLPYLDSHFAEESDSSNKSTPAAIYASGSDSDSVTSFDRSHDQDLQSRFPKPPTSTNGDSTLTAHLHYGKGKRGGLRVESSPLFTEEETDAVKKFLRRRWATDRGQGFGGEDVGVGGRQAGGDWEEYETDFSWEAESPMHTEHLGTAPVFDSSASFVNNGAASRVPCSPSIDGFGDVRAHWSVVRGLGYDAPTDIAGHEPQLGQARVSADPAANHSDVASGRQRLSQQHGMCTASALSSPAPRVVRKSASMRASNKPDRVVIGETLPLRIPSKSPSALDRLEASIMELHAHRSSCQQVQSVPISSRMPARKERPKPVPFPHDFVSLAASGRKHPSHRSQVSLPSAMIRCTTEGMPSTAHSSMPTPVDTSLAKPFRHRTTWSPSQAPAVQSRPTTLNTTAAPDRVLKSFMDITPEQEVRLSSAGVHKERVRKLLARASSGILGWRKSFTRKGSVPVGR